MRFCVRQADTRLRRVQVQSNLCWNLPTSVQTGAAISHIWFQLPCFQSAAGRSMAPSKGQLRDCRLPADAPFLPLLPVCVGSSPRLLLPEARASCEDLSGFGRPCGQPRKLEPEPCFLGFWPSRLGLGRHWDLSQASKPALSVEFAAFGSHLGGLRAAAK